MANIEPFKIRIRQARSGLYIAEVVEWDKTASNRLYCCERIPFATFQEAMDQAEMWANGSALPSHSGYAAKIVHTHPDLGERTDPRVKTGSREYYFANEPHSTTGVAPALRNVNSMTKPNSSTIDPHRPFHRR